MKNSVMALVACAGIVLAPVSSAHANTGPAQPEDVIASAWVPATLAEQQVARGGGMSFPRLSPLINALNTVCTNFNFTIRLNGSNNKRVSNISCGGHSEAG